MYKKGCLTEPPGGIHQDEAVVAMETKKCRQKVALTLEYELKGRKEQRGCLEQVVE